MSFGQRRKAPVGVVLAGGLGRRLGGDKATVELEGRPLLHYVLDALREVCPDVAVVAKRDTLLPGLTGTAEIWVEPETPRHPLTGVLHALRLAGGRPVLAAAVDLPCLDGTALRSITEADPGDAAVVAPVVHGRLQPLCALYRPQARTRLEGFDPSARASDVVRALGVCEVQPPDSMAFLNVNRPEDLIQAAVCLSGTLPVPRPAPGPRR